MEKQLTKEKFEEARTFVPATVKGVDVKVSEAEKAALTTVITDFNQFFNFVNLNGSWYRWLSGEYQISKVDSIGETICKYLSMFCEENGIAQERFLSINHMITVSHRGVYYLFRTLNGNGDYAAVSIAEVRPKARIVPWNTLSGYIQRKFEEI
ncbi:MAG: hypothetical protein K0M69_01335 [Youngiibacter sp.]|nr:hypothetical protein [Youngiibacter sp.]